ncbi:response regulator [Brevibacillus reuszeri]|uniref:response regulator n=1 Tax=Brevibacillus reuszeri TaxID=54915 RepID=UPI00289E992A|nr:response regulator [Brevibacillus reuszeri]
MKFRTRLYAGFCIIIVLGIILVSVMMSMLNQLNHNLNRVVQERYEKVRLVNIIYHELNSISRDSRGLLANPPSELLPTFQESINQNNAKMKQALEDIGDLENEGTTRELVRKLRGFGNIYQDNQYKIEALREAGKEEEANRLYWYESRDIREQMFETIDELKKIEEQAMADELAQSRNGYELTVKMTYIYVVVGVVIGIGVTIWVVRSLTGSLNRITSVMTEVADYETDKLPRLTIHSEDEIGAISNAYNNMAEALEGHIRKVKEFSDTAESQSWFKTQVAEMATMYAGIESLQELASLFITKVTPMVGASYGVFYTKEGKGEATRMRKLAAYADNEGSFRGEFRLGEGLVGQCALENREIILTDIPDDYIKITSGIGLAKPTMIMILPADFEGEVLAVVELASFTEFNSLQQMLFDEVMSSVGVTINSIVSRMQVEKLLQESQALTEELQSQSEELQLQQEELRTINEKLEEQYENSEQKTAELEKTRMILEEKAQQLAISSQYKSEFLANMSHELRTPLNSLLILAQMLAENNEKTLLPKQVEYANTIHSAGNDLLHLINDILDLAKIESGNDEVYPEEVTLQTVKTLVEKQFMPVARQRGLQFTVDLSAGLPKMIWTDERRLQQILKNLLSNAFKFTEQGSVRLHIGMANEEISGIHDDRVIAFSVLDTGIGVSKENQEIIFEEFKQADGTTSRKYGGTGLGLSISRKIAELLGGHIGIESEEGLGSTFTLYLPARHADVRSGEREAAAGVFHDEEAVQSITEAGSAEALLVGKKILIVDDDMRNIFALTTAIEGHHMKVVFAENGREAIDVLVGNPDIDLILMDIMMPEMDGFEAMRIIRQKKEYQTLPIIALTAKAMKHDREQCIEAGASDYISKPVNLEQLFSLMRVWLYR